MTTQHEPHLRYWPDTEILQDSRATLAQVSYVIPGAGIHVSATGSAWRERADAPDPVTGELLAAARAYRVLAARMEKLAGGRVRNADAIRVHRAKRAARKLVEAAEMKVLAADPAVRAAVAEAKTGDRTQLRRRT